jgi:hypothetical protein
MKWLMGSCVQQVEVVKSTKLALLRATQNDLVSAFQARRLALLAQRGRVLSTLPRRASTQCSMSARVVCALHAFACRTSLEGAVLSRGLHRRN